MKKCKSVATTVAVMILTLFALVAFAYEGEKDNEKAALVIYLMATQYARAFPATDANVTAFLDWKAGKIKVDAKHDEIFNAAAQGAYKNPEHPLAELSFAFLIPGTKKAADLREQVEQKQGRPVSDDEFIFDILARTAKQLASSRGKSFRRAEMYIGWMVVELFAEPDGGPMHTLMTEKPVISRLK